MNDIKIKTLFVRDQKIYENFHDALKDSQPDEKILAVSALYSKGQYFELTPLKGVIFSKSS